METVGVGARVPTVLVLGGAGFIGRHVVAELAQRACQVVVGSRKPGRAGRRLAAVAGPLPTRTTRFEDLLLADTWLPLLQEVDVVVNCVGILRQRGRETYDAIHHLAPAALAQACARQDIQLVHVSALGLETGARSRFLHSKIAGDQAIRDSGADWRIVRPSLLDGSGGFGARWLRQLARLPIHAFPADATGRLAALHVEDLGKAIARLALMPPRADNHEAREFGLGGTCEFSLADYLAALRDPALEPALRLPVPSWIARLASHACDLVHFSPFSYGHWELLRRDNRPDANRLPELLGRAPRAVGRFNDGRAKIAFAAAPLNAPAMTGG